MKCVSKIVLYTGWSDTPVEAGREDAGSYQSKVPFPKSLLHKAPLLHRMKSEERMWGNMYRSIGSYLRMEMLN